MAMDGQKDGAKDAEKQQAKSATTKTPEKPQPKVKRPKPGVEVTNELPPKWDPDIDGQPQAIEGYYRGKKHLNSGDGGFDIHIIEQIDDETGELDSISFAGGIADRMMARVPRDTYVWIEYKGRIKASKGKARDFKIVVEDGVELLPET